MYKSFDEIITAAGNCGPKILAVAVAQSLDVLVAIKQAEAQGLVKPILVGEAGLIKPLAERAGFKNVEIVDEADSDQAALKAAELVRLGQAHIMMKGLINSSNFLRAVLNKNRGLRSSRLLCHLGVFEVPGAPRLMFHSDGGMNISPGLEEKKEILINVLKALKNMGLSLPNVAVLSHNEIANDKIPSAADAAALVKMAATGELPPCVIEGPMAMDVAASAAAAAHKKIESRVSGRADVFLMPNIEAGNIAGKTLIYYAKARFAGLILGAAAPIVMSSRSDTPAAKLASIALACLAAPRAA